MLIISRRNSNKRKFYSVKRNDGLDCSLNVIVVDFLVLYCFEKSEQSKLSKRRPLLSKGPFPFIWDRDREVQRI